MKWMRLPCRMPLLEMQTRRTKGHDRSRKSSKQERDAGGSCVGLSETSGSSREVKVHVLIHRGKGKYFPLRSPRPFFPRAKETPQKPKKMREDQQAPLNREEIRISRCNSSRNLPDFGAH
jgi:hypothetical protein